MKGIINKLKPVFLLLSMSLVCVGIVWVTNQLRSSSNYVSGQERVMQSPVIPETEETPSIVQDTSKPLEVKESDDASVLGVESYQCKNKIQTYIKSQSVCERESSAELEDEKRLFLQDGLKISLNASIILTRIVVPLELLSGVEVADSNRLITSKTPTLKAAGEQIDEMSANVLLPPGKQIDTYKGWEAEKPFQFDFKTAFADLGESETGRIGVDTKLNNNCEDCNNASNVNPDKSNKMSEFMLDSIYRYPGEKATIEQKELIEKCSDKDTFTDWKYSGKEREWEACTLNVFEKTLQQIKNLLNQGALADWVKCNLPGATNKEDCVEVKDIIIIMASPFGSDTDCVDGVCTNAYMNRRNTTLLEPGADLGGKQYYLTDCKALVSGVVNQVDVKCAWDMSHLFKERKLNEFDDAPGVDSTPSDSAYNQFLLEQVKGKRDIDSLEQL